MLSLLAYIKSRIDLLSLQLDDLIVLTEAANGHYHITPIIASLAGAKVYAIAKDSAYGTKEDVIEFVRNKAKLLNPQNDIHFLTELSPEILAQVDIVTNLGFVRPLDENLLSQLKTKAVISLMCEAWELRKEDIDKDTCRKLNIHITGVNEHNLTLNAFHYVGNLMRRMLMDAKIEIEGNSFFVYSSDAFGAEISKMLIEAGASISPLESADHLIIADYSSLNPIIDFDGILTAEKIKSINPKMKVIHLAGIVNYPYLKKNGIFCYPAKNGFSFRMSKTFSELGIEPVIDLHILGLKAGEILARAVASCSTYDEINTVVSQNDICQLLL